MRTRKRFVEKQEARLFGEPLEDSDSFVLDREGELTFPRIKYVRGSKVDREGNIAWTDYDTNSITIAELGEIFENISRELVPLYSRVHGAMHEYVKGHELNVEVANHPQSEMQHGRYEAAYLDSIEGTPAYIAGLALHKLRMDKGSEKGKWFTKYTNHFHKLEDKFKEYGAELDEMVGLVSDVISGKPTYQHYTATAPSNTYDVGDYRLETVGMEAGI